MKRGTIVVGARGSLLSVRQTEGVIRILRTRHPRCSFRLEKITTLGDRAAAWKRSDTGIFVKEIEDALVKGKIDIAVHSVKDMPSKLPAKLFLAAVTRREDPRDILIARRGADLFRLPAGCCIGTSSLRRQAQILHIRPDACLSELRGNLDTRIRKLQEGLYDAIVVAVVGLRRLGIKHAKGCLIPETIMLPQTGQGALGIEIRRNDREASQLVKCLDDAAAHACIAAERAFLRETKAGCRMPVAALATIAGARMTMEGLIISLDGRKMIRLRCEGPRENAQVLGTRLARQVLKNGGAQILKEIRNAE